MRHTESRAVGERVTFWKLAAPVAGRVRLAGVLTGSGAIAGLLQPNSTRRARARSAWTGTWSSRPLHMPSHADGR